MFQQHIKLIITILILYITNIIAQHDHETQDHDEHDSHDEYFNIHTTEYHDEHDENIWRAIGITTFAGSASFFGAFAMFFIKKEQIFIMPVSLAFGAGVTIYLSLVNLIPESMDQFHHALQHQSQSEAMADIYCLLCVIFGIFITYLTELLFHHIGIDPHHHNSDSPSNTITTTKSTTYSDDADLARATKVSIDAFSPTQVDHRQTKRNSGPDFPDTDTDKPRKPITNYSRVSYSVAFALILHHFPEGIATFVSLYHDFEFGILVTFALALHDVPSGVCISVPMYLASGSKTKPFILCFLAGVIYPVGALIGWIIIEMGTQQFLDTFIAILFGVTGGIMLYISFVELLPTAIIAANKYSTKNQAYCNVSRVSISLLFIGLLVMAVSNIVLNAVGGHSH